MLSIHSQIHFKIFASNGLVFAISAISDWIGAGISAAKEARAGGMEAGVGFAAPEAAEVAEATGTDVVLTLGGLAVDVGFETVATVERDVAATLPWLAAKDVELLGWLPTGDEDALLVKEATVAVDAFVKTVENPDEVGKTVVLLLEDADD